MLRENINNAVKDAMKARDERLVGTLRMMNAAIKNADIAARGEGKEPLNEADLMSLFQKMIKAEKPVRFDFRDAFALARELNA